MRLIAAMVVLAQLGSFSLNARGRTTPVLDLSKEQTSCPWYSSTYASDLHFTEISGLAGITFKHVFSPEKKYIVESMSGGVALFDYDNDGYLDIYLVNSLTVDLANSHQKTRIALYLNKCDRTFPDLTDQSGVADIGF